MTASIDWYRQNPMITRDRRLSRSESPWVRSFACEDVRPLIVCRGPIRKEAMDVFEQMGITHYGILLSEKDSIVYTNALAPELRSVAPEHVHRVKDYTGASKEERVERMHEICAIAKRGGYTHVFAGYGFMAEDEEFVRTIEEAGLTFMGPASSVQRAAGLKDEAKRTALANDVSVTPGVDDATRRILLKKYPTLDALAKVVAQHGLPVPAAKLQGPLHAVADEVLAGAYAKRVDLYTIDELADELVAATVEIRKKHPGKRLRYKAIGGGGGKGQRILDGQADPAATVPGLVREILQEVKAGGVGDNKNILLEMNIERTRHNEIQLIGNGDWCLALGGRDCSLQMHEQKLLEISITKDGLEEALWRARTAGHAARVKSLEQEIASLARMETEAERFGKAVGLNSASTFECIVEDDHHYFMEVNTRIQVEHRVTELCYGLRFANPDDPSDAFEVHSLVECMVLLARHGKRLPRPTRTKRQVAAIEARLNATNRALEPHAGGKIVAWSNAIEHEVRDDQGICVRNPDTGMFVHYRLAGAYDSNVALLVTYGDSREQSYERLLDILRRTNLRGNDLATNLEFHYGLAQWFASRDVWAKPTTRFVVPYLTQVGLLAQEAANLDFDVLWTDVTRRYEGWLREGTDGSSADASVHALRRTLAIKETLIRRPIERLCAEPHLLSAWLSRNLASFTLEAGQVRCLKNPIEVLADTYWLLHMEYRPSAPAANVIWDHDHDLLERARGFYRRLEERFGELGLSTAWPALTARLSDEAPPKGFTAELWQKTRAAHVGFQAGCELLQALIRVGERTRFFDLKVEPDGEVVIPERLLDKKLQDQMKKVLVPPPVQSSNEIVAVSGGMFYAQEAPDRPPFVTKGAHFNAGDPLYIVEVMKMFNRVYAPFAGTIDAVLIEQNGTIVHKGQPLFRVTPDEPVVVEDPAIVTKRRKDHTKAYVEAIFGAGWHAGM